MPRPLLPFLLLILFALPLRAQTPDPRQPQIDAAISNAVDGLYREISHTPLYSRLTAGDLLTKTETRDDLLKLLQSAQQIGGPRWLDDQTAQIRLEIAGSRVSQTLLQIATSHPTRSPISPSALEPLLADWTNRTFAATGTSTGAAAVTELRPTGPNNAWSTVPEQSRRDVIAAARTDAIARTLASLRPISIQPDLRLATLLDRPNTPLKSDLESFLAARPVTSVQFRDDRQVDITLSTSPDDLTGAIRTSLAHLADPRLTDIDWPKITREISSKILNIQGSAKVPPGGTVGGGKGGTKGVLITLPSRPPDWSDHQLDTEATAGGSPSALKNARSAETRATEKLLLQLQALPLLPGLTLGQAASKDPRIQDALTHSLTFAQTRKTDYHPDNTVTLYLTLDLKTLWDQLRQIPSQ